MGSNGYMQQFASKGILFTIYIYYVVWLDAAKGRFLKGFFYKYHSWYTT